MMPDFDDGLQNGGWTLVGRAVGGAKGCWAAGGAQGCNIYGMSNVAKSFRLKDSTIQSIPHTQIRWQGVYFLIFLQLFSSSFFGGCVVSPNVTRPEAQGGSMCPGRWNCGAVWD